MRGSKHGATDHTSIRHSSPHDLMNRTQPNQMGIDRNQNTVTMASSRGRRPRLKEQEEQRKLAHKDDVLLDELAAAARSRCGRWQGRERS